MADGPHGVKRVQALPNAVASAQLDCATTEASICKLAAHLSSRKGVAAVMSLPAASFSFAA